MTVQSDNQGCFADDNERKRVARYLHELYVGAFTEEAIQAHLENHVGFAFAGYTVDLLRIHSSPGDRVLDIGAGFGSCVIAARQAGFDAFGVEIAQFEVEFSRQRLWRIRPQDDPESVFLQGDATQLNIAAGSVDAVTFWNVLEHIADVRQIVNAAHAMLRPGGNMYILCPNYNAWRLEAHYHVPWSPGLSRDRRRASEYLRSMGRDPRYFESSIFCRNNWEILGLLGKLGYGMRELGDQQPLARMPTNLKGVLRWPGRVLRFVNPCKQSVSLVAQKRLTRASNV